MKKTKKAVAGLTALFMAFSMTAFAACETNDGNTGDDGNNGEPPAIVKTDAEKIMEAAAKQRIGGMSGVINLNMNHANVSYASDEEGKKLQNAEEEKTYYKTDMTLSGAVNLKNLNVDASSVLTEWETDANGTEKANTRGSDYSYYFMRGGFLYTYYSDSEVTDFSSVVLNKLSGGAFVMPVAADGYAGVPLNTFINLSRVYNANSFADKKLTINLNKVVYSLYTDVIGVINGLKDTTTVGEVVESAPVKNLIHSLTYGYTAKDIYDEVKEGLGGDRMPAGIKGYFDLAPVPAEGVSVYDYLVSVLKSKAFAEDIIGLVSSDIPASAIAPLYDFAVLDIAKLFLMSSDSDTPSLAPATQAETGDSESSEPTMTMENLKAMIKDYVDMVSATEDTVTVNIPDYNMVVNASALQAVISVNDNYEIISAEVTGDAVIETQRIRKKTQYIPGSGDSDDTTVVSYTTHKETINADVKATLTVSETISLKNISSNKALLNVGELKANHEYYFTLYIGRDAAIPMRVTIGEENAVTKLEVLDETYKNVVKEVKNDGGEGVKVGDYTVTGYETELQYDDYYEAYLLYINIAKGEDYWRYSVNNFREMVTVG